VYSLEIGDRDPAFKIHRYGFVFLFFSGVGLATLAFEALPTNSSNMLGGWIHSLQNLSFLVIAMLVAGFVVQSILNKYSNREA